MIVFSGDGINMDELRKHLPQPVPETICFPEWSAQQCKDFFLARADSHGFVVSKNAIQAVVAAFETLGQRPQWASAEDANIAYEHKVLRARRQRVQNGDITASIPYEDVAKGMDSFLDKRPTYPAEPTSDRQREQFLGKQFPEVKEDLEAELRGLKSEIARHQKTVDRCSRQRECSEDATAKARLEREQRDAKTLARQAEMDFDQGEAILEKLKVRESTASCS
eukprot:gb/GECG01003810.1/.p1 GENE.gb/GECG01003810.1/~~gb/GECG01003810.1/.p1  ORF type:complete len:223 (+),score=34.07 gb/GECG01003810.1/:1-669(+)